MGVWTRPADDIHRVSILLQGVAIENRVVMCDLIPKHSEAIDALVGDLSADGGRNVREGRCHTFSPKEVLKRLGKKLNPKTECKAGDDVIAGEGRRSAVLLFMHLPTQLFLMAIRQHVDKFVIAVPTRAVVSR